MMKCRRITALVLALALSLGFSLPGRTLAKAATVLTDSMEGRDRDYTYSLWKDHGTTSMTINGDGKFECSWENIGNALFREGIKFDCTKKYKEIGDISVEYGVDYQPDGNSYLCIYGWSRDPLIEYYIVESWGTWRPPGAESKGTVKVDGGTYDIYETTRVNQPSIDGNTTFKQYWSVRTSKRTSGTVSVTEHFKAWEKFGMDLGKLYESCLTIEGYQSSGWAEVYLNKVTVGEKSDGSSGGKQDSGNDKSGTENVSGKKTGEGTRYECESMAKSGPYAGSISYPFEGVALYANDDNVSGKIKFSSGIHDFTLRGNSNGSNIARVDLVIGGQTVGTFTLDNSSSGCTIENIAHKTGKRTVKLIVTTDNGTWDAFLDCLIIKDSGLKGIAAVAAKTLAEKLREMFGKGK